MRKYQKKGHVQSVGKNLKKSKKVLDLSGYPCYINEASPNTWFLGQAVKTSPSHGENRSSILLGTTTRHRGDGGFLF